MTTRYELGQAYSHNLRNNQIGGERDGIPEDVAADLGFETYDQYLAIVAQTDAAPQESDDQAVTEHMTLADRDALLTEAFAAAALVRKAVGREHNIHARGKIARQIGTSAGEVNRHGREMKDEHMTRLRAAVFGLVGDQPTAVADEHTAQDFLDEYYTGAEAAKKRRRMQRVIKNRQKNHQ